MGRGRVANQYANTAVRAPMPTKVEVGRERKNWLRSSISGILRPLIMSWTCIFSIRVELNSAEESEILNTACNNKLLLKLRLHHFDNVLLVQQKNQA